MSKDTKTIWLFRGPAPDVYVNAYEEETLEKVENERSMSVKSAVEGINLTKKYLLRFNRVILAGNTRTEQWANILLINSDKPLSSTMYNIMPESDLIARMCVETSREHILVVFGRELIINTAVKITQDLTIRSIDLDFCEGIRINLPNGDFEKISPNARKKSLHNTNPSSQNH
ncbi:MAG: hypothetical protein WD335_03090 [Candidatus Paceibacterota bacterium]